MSVTWPPDPSTTVLENDGHEIVAVGENGFDGVTLYKEHSPDLTLLDITMPNKDGHSSLAEILEYDPAARVLMVSAVKVRSKIIDCLTLGAKGYVEKPLRLGDEQFCQGFRDSIKEALTDELC